MKKILGLFVALAIAGTGLSTPAHADLISANQLETSFVPSESYFSDGTLWGLNSAYGINESGALEVTTGSKDIVVGIIDSGITSHSDLNANVIPGYDFVSNSEIANDSQATDARISDRDADPADPGDYYTDVQTGKSYNSSWHGTHVAGIIGGTSDGYGAIGVAPNVSLLPIRALGAGGGLLSDIADAITWGSGGSVSGVPSRTRVDVLNLSLGGSGACPTGLQSVIDAAVSRGTVVVVAAGNDGANLRNTFPANCKNVVTVMATTTNGNRASWSNFNDGTYLARNSIYVYAPGYSIYSTYNSGCTKPNLESDALMSGTSMAAPFVSGIIALMRTVNPTASVSQIKIWLSDSRNQTLGIGNVKILNAGALVRAAGGMPTSMSTPSFPVAKSPFPANSACTDPVVQETGTSIATEPAPVVAPAPVIDPIVAPAPLTFAVKKKLSARNFAAQSGVSVPKKSTVTLKVIGSKTSCKIKSGKLATLKAGSCTVAVKVVTKVKVGKKYKYKSTTKKISLVVQ